MLQRPLPQGPHYIFIGSREHGTTAQALFDRNLRITNFLAQCGDGAVVERSAGNGSALEYNSSAPHATVFETHDAKNYIAYGLGLVDKADIAHAPPPLRPLKYYQQCTDSPDLSQDQADVVRDETKFYVQDAAGVDTCLKAVSLTATATLLKVGEPFKIIVRYEGYRSLLRRDLRQALLVLDETGAVVATLSGPEYRYRFNGSVRSDFVYELTATRPGPLRVALKANGISDDPIASQFAETVMVVPSSGE